MTVQNMARSDLLGVAEESVSSRSFAPVPAPLRLCLAEAGPLWLRASAVPFTLRTLSFPFLSFSSVPVVQQTISGPVLFSLLGVAA